MPCAAVVACAPVPRHPRRSRTVCTLGLLAVLVAACGDAEFERAEHANTPEAWDAYLRMHPDGAHAREARAHLSALVEEREWQRAHAADTPDAYQRFLRAYPQGSHAQEALVALAHVNLAPPAEAPSSAVAPPAPSASPAPAVSVPPVAPPPVSASPVAAPTAAGFRVQLGAFSEGRAAAKRAWLALAARNPELAQYKPLIEAVPARDGRKIHRLQVASLDEHAAEELCTALNGRHDPCVVVPPARPAPTPGH